ncbi:MAG: Lipoprotein-releasing system ATP-binding protein LolD [Gammaproteobacteria bacterium]|nr:Lipoprotein-releasing system ATP-binding protein LolD [Gammaproteobacteria bacterium]
MVEAIDKPIILADALGKTVRSPTGDLTILDDISFLIRPSEAVAVVGVSGSGKSTLLSLLAGLDTPTRGRVLLDGVDLNLLDEDGRAALRASRIGFVFQNFQLLHSMTAMENVMLPLELAGRADAAGQAESILARVGLGERTGHYPNQLSGGEQQRVAIARAFVTRPRILFADEPTGNLDGTSGALVAGLLFSLRAEAGTTLMLVTHDMTLATRCDRRITLIAGRMQSAP